MGQHIRLMLLLVTLVAASASECESLERNHAANERRQVNLVVIGECEDAPTWPVIQRTCANYVRTHPSLRIRCVAPQSASPHEQQVLLQGLVDSDADAICVAPLDPTAIRAVIKTLASNGRPVVTLGMDVSDSNRAKYCGPLESDIGRAAAKGTVFALTTEVQTVMVLHAGAENPIYATRYTAFKQALPMEGRAKILRDVDCNASPLDADRLVRLETRRYPRAGCWVFLEDWPMRTLQRNDRIVPLGCGVVLCNGSPRYFDRLRNGQIQAIVTYDYQQALEQALIATASLGEGQLPDRNKMYIVPMEIITTANIDSFEKRWEAWRRGESSPLDQMPTKTLE